MPESISRNKILILTLGAGTPQTWTEQEKALSQESGKNGYKKAKYSYQDLDTGKSVEIESPFVGEILVQCLKPDQVIFIGTVKSIWTQVLYWFTKKNGDYLSSGDKLEPSESLRNDFNLLQEIQSIELGQTEKTTTEKLNRYEQDIEDIFRKWSIFKQCGKINIKVILTYYGITEEQLIANYYRMKKIKSALDTYRTNEISFDITHSFRSLALYNLAIVNYLQSVSEQEVILKHVFYGNLEVSRENNGIAKVVDLQYLIQIMAMTNGAREFKDTGNAKTLVYDMQRYSNTQDRFFWGALKDFNWAAQMNEYGALLSSLETLQNLKSENAFTAESDVHFMVKQILGQSFSKIDISDMPECQYKIAKWYLKNERYGLAAATGYEALKAFLLCICAEYKKQDITEELLTNENKRRESIQRLVNVSEYLKKNNRENESAMTKFLCKLASSGETLKNTRNVFAHNLSFSEKMQMGAEELAEDNTPEKTIIKETLKAESNSKAESNPKESDSEKNIPESEKVEEAFKIIDRLNAMFEVKGDDLARFEKTYCMKTHVRHKHKKGVSIRLIISNDEVPTEVCVNLSKGVDCMYEVETLPEEIRSSLRMYEVSSKENFMKDIHSLLEYLKNEYPEDNPPSLILYDLSLAQELNYGVFLKTLSGYENNKVFILRKGTEKLLTMPALRIFDQEEDF